MRRVIYLLTVIFFLLCGFSESVWAQQALTIKVAKTDGFFTTREDGSMYAEFILKGMDKEDSTKPLKEKVLALPGVQKFAVKNVSDDISDERRTYLVLDNENYLGVFEAVLILLDIKEVTLPDATYNINQFLELCK